jgi:alpha-methylacyl-CoA racemase
VPKLDSFLRGIQVIDLSQNLPGPFASLLLADMGACVLKIEPPSGDSARWFGPGHDEGSSAFYEAVNSGKYTTCLDLKSDEGRCCVLRLAESADIVIESYRPGVMRKLRLGYEDIRQRKSDTIYCSITGYGQGESSRAGHDGNFLAETGVLDRNGSREPVLFDPPPADMAGSLLAVTSILGALRARDRGLGGCHLDLGLADSVHLMQIRELADYSVLRTSPRRGHSLASGVYARYRLYPTGAGFHVALCALEKKFWVRFCERAGRPDWIERISDPVPQTSLAAQIEKLLLSLTAEQLRPFLEDPDICMSRVHTLEEAVHRASKNGRRLLSDAHGRIQALFPVWVDGQPPGPRSGPRAVPDTGDLDWTQLMSRHRG